MQFTMPVWTIGALIALVVLFLALGVMVFDLHAFSWPLALIVALAVARLT